MTKTLTKQHPQTQQQKPTKPTNNNHTHQTRAYLNGKDEMWRGWDLPTAGSRG